MLPLQTCVLVMQCQRRLSIRRGLGQTMTLPDERTPGNVLLCDAVVQTPHGSGACLASDQLLGTGSAVLLAEDDKMEGAGCRVGRLSLRGGGLWFSRPTTPDEDRRELSPGCHHPGRRTRAPHVPIPPFTVVRLEFGGDIWWLQMDEAPSGAGRAEERVDWDPARSVGGLAWLLDRVTMTRGPCTSHRCGQRAVGKGPATW
jgi:hypothetical protein